MAPPAANTLAYLGAHNFGCGVDLEILGQARRTQLCARALGEALVGEDFGRVHNRLFCYPVIAKSVRKPSVGLAH